MTSVSILIIDNYKNGNPKKIAQIRRALAQAGKTDVNTLSYSVLSGEQVPNDTEAIILSGSEAHLSDSTECAGYEAEMHLVRNTQLPVLGICFGHQLVGRAFGSNLKKGQPIRRFEMVEIVEPDTILSSLKAKKNLQLMENHEDYLEALPDGFVLLARSDSCSVEAMKHEVRPIYGVQAHIERASLQHPDGWDILDNFLTIVVGRGRREQSNWQGPIQAVLAEYSDLRDEIKRRIDGRTRMTEIMLTVAGVLSGAAFYAANAKIDYWFTVIGVIPFVTAFCIANIKASYFVHERIRCYIREVIERRKLPEIFTDVLRLEPYSYHGLWMSWENYFQDCKLGSEDKWNEHWQVKLWGWGSRKIMYDCFQIALIGMAIAVVGGGLSQILPERWTWYTLLYALLICTVSIFSLIPSEGTLRDAIMESLKKWDYHRGNGRFSAQLPKQLESEPKPQKDKSNLSP